MGRPRPPRLCGPAAAAGQPIRGPGQPADVSGVWPAFRGPNRDAICDDGTRLARSWPPQGPPVLWRIELGQGYAGAVIRDGRVYVLDYDEKAKADTMRCLSLADGREIWRNSYPVEVTPNHGCSRTVPALVNECVVSIGPRCHVACWDAETGQCRWLIDMVQRFGAEERQWYTGQCPLVDGDRVILAPCGADALLVAVEYRTGQILWKTPNPRGWKMTHSSVMPTEFAGRKMYVYCGTGGTAGIAADDGRLLWDETSWVENFATSPSPLPLPDGRIFLCSGYDITGAMMLQMKQAGDVFKAEKAYDTETQGVQFRATDARFLPRLPVRRTEAARTDAVHGCQRQRAMEQRQLEIRSRAVHDRRRNDFRLGRQRPVGDDGGHARGLPPAGAVPGLRERP